MNCFEVSLLPAVSFRNDFSIGLKGDPSDFFKSGRSFTDILCVCVCMCVCVCVCMCVLPPSTLTAWQSV